MAYQAYCFPVTIKELTPQINNFFDISEEDRGLFEVINQILSVEVDDKEGLVSISVEFSDRKIAAQLAQAATDLLQTKIIAFKSQSARNNLQFVQAQFDAKRQEFEQIQDSIAMFKDQNLNITSSLYQNQLTRLESQFAVASSVFQELAGQVEQAKIQVNKDTPIFMIIEPVSVPLKTFKTSACDDGSNLDPFGRCNSSGLDACKSPSIPNFKRVEKQLNRLFFTYFSAHKKECDIPKNQVNKKQDYCKLMTKAKGKLGKQHQSSS